MNTWIMGARKLSPQCRLFCFPFAGGSASSYRDWSLGLPETIEVCAINLPGRQARFSETAFSEMEPLTDALVDALAPEMDRPFFFFGHSMGAMVAFELARKLRKQKAPLPRHLFLSARPGPCPQNPDYPKAVISDDDLIAMLSALNGTDKQVLANKELLDFMLPSLRADMNLVQSHSYAKEEPLDCGISAFGGIFDPTHTRQELLQWRIQTRRSFRMHMFSGDHFFLNTQASALLGNILSVIIREIRNG